jgi:hypothetical protein
MPGSYPGFAAYLACRESELGNYPAFMRKIAQAMRDPHTPEVTDRLWERAGPEASEMGWLREHSKPGLLTQNQP